MKIIRDEECCGILMIPLLVDWNIRRCNVNGCTNKPNTIIASGTEEAGVFGLCESCFQEGNKPNGTTYDLVFDEFDAFKATEYEPKGERSN